MTLLAGLVSNKYATRDFHSDAMTAIEWANQFVNILDNVSLYPKCVTKINKIDEGEA